MSVGLRAPDAVTGTPTYTTNWRYEMGILNRKNAKQEREQRKDAAPADDFKDMDDLGSDKRDSRDGLDRDRHECLQLAG